MYRVAVGLIAALSLGACASPYVGKPYDRTSAAVHNLALADDSVPEKVIAYEVASVGSNFGLVGALVDAGIQSSRTAAVNEALSGVSFNGESLFEARLASVLGAQGYVVRQLDGSLREKREFLTAYPAAPEGVDAYLDIVVTGYGYLSAGAGQPFRPTAGATVRLVSAKDTGKTLMENVIIYNGMAPREGVITLTANPEYEFRNREALLADPTRLAAGLEDALNQVVDAAAKTLQ